MNKTAFILSMPNASAKDVVAAAAKKKMVFSEAYVYSIRSKATKKGSAAPPKKRGRPARASGSTGAEVAGSVPEPVSNGVPTNDSDLELAIKRIGTDRAGQILSETKPPEGEPGEIEFITLVRELGAGRAKIMIAQMLTV